MRVKLGFVALFLSMAPLAAGAFFFFIPGKLIDSAADALTGSEGQHCVAIGAKVGDKIRLPGGGQATVKSLSGTSMRCSNPQIPIRALLDFGDTGQVSGAGMGEQSALREPAVRPPENPMSDPRWSAPPPVSVAAPNQAGNSAPVPILIPASSSTANPPVVQPAIPPRVTPNALADRLKQLEALRKEGLITAEEFQDKRKRLLDEL